MTGQCDEKESKAQLMGRRRSTRTTRAISRFSNIGGSMALNVSNSPQDALARQGPGPGPGRSQIEPLPAQRKRWFSRKQEGELRIYQHSNLLYWWPIWAYGFLCAALTYVQGIGV